MNVVIGLGNPGKTYEHTRHNVGFAVIDELARREGVSLKKSWRLTAITGEIKTKSGANVLLVKPQTFMNQSGVTVAHLMRRKGIEAKDLMVVVDDLDLSPGVLRIRKKGSAGGHNGLKSIIEHLGTDEFIRIRVGVGKPQERGDTIKHVLSRFDGEENETVRATIQRASDAVMCILDENIEKAMNAFNG